LASPHAGHEIPAAAASGAGADGIGFPQLLQNVAVSALTALQAGQFFAM
jgi:hypothetical protein